MHCREIPEKMWQEAREALVFYFSRRFGFDRAEDLAQETLLRVFGRPDYMFKEIGDFPKICIGFARYVAYEQRREAAKWVTVDWESELSNPAQYGPGPEVPENIILLRETLEAGQLMLNDQERHLIANALERDPGDGANKPVESKNRVRLSRARRKLSVYIGWKKDV
jgi:DNA-directed RNA polymerase specialized sigma24 family protein